MRRVVVPRRRLKGDVVLSAKDDPQGTLAFMESAVATAGYEISGAGDLVARISPEYQIPEDGVPRLDRV